MKTNAKKVMLALIALACFLYAAPLKAIEVTPWSEWTTGQKTGYVAAVIAQQIDWAQTRSAMRQPDKYKEMNPLLGSHPSTGSVDRFGLSVGLAISILPWICDECRRAMPIVGSIFVVNVSRHHFLVGVRASW